MFNLRSWSKLSATIAGASCLTFLGITVPAHAALITSSAAISSPTVIDFSQFASSFQFTSGPVQIGNSVEDIQWSTNASNSVIGNGDYFLVENGLWDSGRNGYTGSNSSFASMVFTFNSGLKSAVGGLLNYAPGFGSPVLIEALGEGGVVLESYDLLTVAPISTPSQTNQGAFRGIQRASNDIRALRVSNGYVVLDDLTFASNSTPIPTPALLPGLVGMGIAALRKKKQEEGVEQEA